MLLLQNPMNSIYEPDYGAAGGPGTGWMLALLVILYGVSLWAIVAGPLRDWADENKGPAYALLAFVPGLVVLGIVLVTS